MHFRNFAPDRLLWCENNAFCTSARFLVPLFGALRPPPPQNPLHTEQNPAFWHKSAPYSTKIALFFTSPRRPAKSLFYARDPTIIAISSTGEPYFLVNSFAFSIFFVFLPKDMSLHRTTNGRKSCFRTGKRQKAKPLHNLPSAQIRAPKRDSSAHAMPPQNKRAPAHTLFTRSYRKHRCKRPDFRQTRKKHCPLVRESRLLPACDQRL